MHRVAAISPLYVRSSSQPLWQFENSLPSRNRSLAQKVEGVVLDPNGDPIPDMTVTDRTQDGAVVLRSTKTDRRGHFHFPTQRGKTVYCLRFDHPLWNPLQLTVKLDKCAPDRGITAKPEIGG